MEERILDILNQLATKLGTTSEFIFEIMTKRAFITGIVIFVIGILVSASSITAAIICIKNDDTDVRTIGTGLCSIPLYIGIILLYEGIVRIYIPEAEAFKNILELLK